MEKTHTTFRLSESTIKTLDEYMEQNNYSNRTVALENMISDYRKLFDNHISEREIEAELKDIKYDVAEISKRIMVLYEMINSYMVLNNIGSFVSTDDLKNISTEKAEKFVEDQLHAKRLSRKRKK